MNFPDKDGVSERVRLEQIQQQLGEQLEELIPPPFPEPLTGYWESFLELHSARGSGEGGPDPLSFSEIKAWAELSNHAPSNRELTCIRTLDRLYLKEYSAFRANQLR
jgi:hypothetical protein